ncbi:MAG: helix-turn-helix domain-containing protein [Bacteroidaceae bacterium]|nr:helix-turn-helix domain-containing protein [Bacteroidaceae bacterium]
MTIEGELCKLVAQPSTMIVDDQRRALNMLLDVRSGLLWSTTRDNLYAYKIDSEGFLQEYPLTGIVPSGKKILDQMCQDRDGNIYVSGFTPHTFIISGANKDIVRIIADAIQRSEGYPLLADRSVHDGYNHIWIWQGRQGLMLYDRVQDLAEVAPIRCERDIQASSLGGIWAFNGAHVYRLWQIDGAIQQEEFMKFHDGEHVRCVFEKAGEALYVAVDSTLYRQTLIGRQQTKVADFPSSPLEFTVTDDGTVFLAMGPDGVYCVHPGGDVKRISDVSESFLSVCAMSDGTVWMSTNEGRVFFYNPLDGQFSMEPLLSSPNRAAIRCVRTDGLGHLWTLTDQLVCEYSPQSRAFRTFRSNDPFINVSYFYALEPIDASSICLDGAGALIDVQSSPELSLQKASQVRPRLTCVRVGNERRLVGRDAELLELAAGEEDFSLELSTLDHLHASSISFAYQLEDIHNKWIYLPQGHNTIFIANMPKGSHILRVMATDRHGLWSQPVEVITIQRAPHWWETWWAYLLYICIAFIVVYGIVRLERRIHLLRNLIHRRQEVRLNEIEMTRDDISEQQRNDEFLKQAIAKVEEHLSETEYNVESLSSDLFMSRITLYRHIQEQTGQTPVEFIRDIRLKKAALLLSLQPEASVSDVARKVGFGTPKYFSKCFKEKFGVLPKDYKGTQHLEG